MNSGHIMVEEELEPLVNKQPTVDINETMVDQDSFAWNSETDSAWSWFYKPSVLRVALALGMICFSSLSMSVKEIALFDRACETNMKPDGSCSSLDNQLLVSNTVQWVSVISNIVSIIGMASCGKFSDAYGRRPILAISAFTYFMGSCLAYFVLFHSNGLKVKTYILVISIQSCFGKIIGFGGLCNSYVSDITKPENKAAAMLFIGGFQFLGIFLGNLICPSLIKLGKHLGRSTADANKLPFYVELGVLAINTIYCFTIPESKTFSADNTLDLSFSLSIETIQSKLKSIQFRPKKLLAHIFSPLLIFGVPESSIPPSRKHELPRIRFSVIVLVTTFLTSALVSAVVSTVLIQYGIYEFKWDSETISYLIVVSSTSAIVALLGIFPFLNRVVFRKWLKLQFLAHHFDAIDFATLLVGLIGDILFSLPLCVISSSAEILAPLMISGLDGCLAPTVTSIMTKFYNDAITGEVIMALIILNSIANIGGPLVSLQLYKFGLTHDFVTLPFVVLAIWCMCVIVLVILDRIFTKTDGSIELPDEDLESSSELNEYDI